ncbi:hypothetical protein CHU98_g12264, partial [Xylaria longipes]
AQGAVSLSVAEKYVDAFGKLARESTAVVVPGNVGDIGGMIATALSVYGKVGDTQSRAMAKQLLEKGNVIPGEEAKSGAERHKPSESIVDSVVREFDSTTAKR